MNSGRKNTVQQAYLEQVAAPVGLLGRILLCIKREQALRSNRRRLFAWMGASVVSIAALVPALLFFRSEVAASGLFQYFSLISFSPALIAAHWTDFLASLSESLPILGFTIVAGIAALTLWSVDELVYYGRALSKSQPTQSA